MEDAAAGEGVGGAAGGPTTAGGSAGGTRRKRLSKFSMLALLAVFLDKASKV